MNIQFVSLLHDEIGEIENQSRRISEEIRASGRGAHWVSCWGDRFHVRRRRAMELAELIDDRETREETQRRIRRIP